MTSHLHLVSGRCHGCGRTLDGYDGEALVDDRITIDVHGEVVTKLVGDHVVKCERCPDWSDE